MPQASKLEELLGDVWICSGQGGNTDLLRSFVSMNLRRWPGITTLALCYATDGHRDRLVRRWRDEMGKAGGPCPEQQNLPPPTSPRREYILDMIRHENGTVMFIDTSHSARIIGEIRDEIAAGAVKGFALYRYETRF